MPFLTSNPPFAGTQIGDKTLMANWFSGLTNEAKITTAIARAVAIGALYVYVPARMLPYDASKVTFNTAIWMVREGGDFDVHDIKAYGAAGNTTNNDTSAIQAALNASAVNRAIVFIPATTSGQYYKITTTLTLPIINGLVVKGAGMRIAQIRQTTAGIPAMTTNNVWATAVNGLILEDFGLALGTYALDLKASNRFRINRVRFESATLAGLHIADCLIGLVSGCEFDANFDGVKGQNGGNTGLNSISFTDNTFENNTNIGCNLVDGASGLRFMGNVVENNLKGGLYMGQDIIGIEVVGNYFEENTDHASTTFDIFVGATSYVRGAAIEGNYFNGRAGGAGYDYYPIRAKYAHALRCQFNYVNVGNRWVNFEAGAVVVSSRFGPNAFAVAFDISAFANAYNGMTHATAIANGVSMTEPALSSAEKGRGELLVPNLRVKAGAGARMVLDREANANDSAIRYATAGTDKWYVGPSADGASSENLQWYNIATAVMTMYLDAATDTLVHKAGVAAGAPMRIPHGVAPTSPVNGDVWTTTAGMFVRVNGATVGPLT